MKMKKSLLMIGVALAFASCSKEGDIPVVEATDSSMEILAKEPVPGDYTIEQFVENGEDRSANFVGWKFDFQSDGDLIATSPRFHTYSGTWDMNYSETEIDLIITGTPGLDHLSSKDWTVTGITNKGMQFSTAVDLVIFKPDGGY